MLRPTTRHGEGGGMEGSALAPALTASLAQEIAGDTSDIIGFNVLITDRNGTVIGSGDRNRVGTFHEASVEVVRTMQPATHNAAQARSLRGVRPGITLPIVLGETALGTVGITGSPAQVRRFGLVVKRQTEILLRESVVLRSRLLRERAMEDLVRDIAYFDAEVVEPELIAYRAGELGYDLAAPRVAVVVDLVAPPDHGEPADTDQSTARLALHQTSRPPSSNCTTHTRTRASPCGSAPGSLPAVTPDRRSPRSTTCASTSFLPRSAIAPAPGSPER